MGKRTIEIEILVNIGGSKYRVYDKSNFHEDWDLEACAASEVEFLARKMGGALQPCFYDHAAINTKLKDLTKQSEEE
jgi:hypothetical protein